MAKTRLKRGAAFIIAAAILFALAACSSGAGGEADKEQKFPDFEGMDLYGNAVDSGIFAENAFTVVNFWFSDCPPCLAELGDLDALNESVKEEGGEVIGINTYTLLGREDLREQARGILESSGARYRNVWFDADSEAGQFCLSVEKYPTTCVVDREGNIVGGGIFGGINNRSVMDALREQIDIALERDGSE